MSVVPGLTGEAKATVNESNTAAAVGSGGIPVFSTPNMIGLMEMAALWATAPHLAPGETTVGISVNIKHLAASPLGMQIRASARLVAVEGRKLTFEVEAYDEVEKIGDGVHERYIVQAEKFLARVRQKSAPK